MTNFVIKKDGTKVPFDSEKIKSAIVMAASEAGLSDDEKNDIAEKVSSSVVMAFEDKEEVLSTEIKNKILSELDASFPVVSEAWRKYEQTKSE